MDQESKTLKYSDLRQNNNVEHEINDKYIENINNNFIIFN